MLHGTPYGKMSIQSAYLQRRGLSFGFRIAIPFDLRILLESREITKGIGPVDKAVAVPMALEYAARAKRVFNQVRIARRTMDKDKLREVVLLAKAKIRLDEQSDEHEREIVKLKQEHISELRLARLESENAALKLAVPGPIGVGGAGVLPATALPPSHLATVEHGRHRSQVSVQQRLTIGRARAVAPPPAVSAVGRF